MVLFSSVQSLSRIDSLRPHELQHVKPPCPSPTHGVHPNPCPSSRWCHPTISSSVIPFSSHLQSFPGSGLFKWVSSSHQVAKVLEFSASTSVRPMNTQDWSSLGWTGWISLQSKGLSRVFSNTTVQKYHSSVLSFLYSPTLISIHDHWKNHSLTRWTFVGKVMSLLLNMLSRLVITFLPGSKCLLISWMQSPSAVILEPRKIKSAIVSTVSPSICHEVMGLDPMIFIFWMLSFKPTFSLSSFSFIKRLFSSSSLSAVILF